MPTYQTVEELDGPHIWVGLWSHVFTARTLEAIFALFIIYAWPSLGSPAPAQRTFRNQRRGRRASRLSDAVKPPHLIVEETESEVEEANEEFVDASECFYEPLKHVEASIPSIERPAAPTTFRPGRVTIDVSELELKADYPIRSSPLKTFTCRMFYYTSHVISNPFPKSPPRRTIPACITPSLTPQPRNHPNFYINNPDYLQPNESERLITLQCIKQFEAAVESRLMGLTRDVARQGKAGVAQISRKLSI